MDLRETYKIDGSEWSFMDFILSDGCDLTRLAAICTQASPTITLVEEYLQDQSQFTRELLIAQPNPVKIIYFLLI